MPTATKKEEVKKEEVKKEMTKAEIVTALAEKTELTKTQVSTVLAELNELIGKNVGRKGPGSFTIPGLLKIETRIKPATKSRKGRNPFTGEEITIKAKPKMKVVKARPLKALKDMI